MITGDFSCALTMDDNTVFLGCKYYGCFREFKWTGNEYSKVDLKKYLTDRNKKRKINKLRR